MKTLLFALVFAMLETASAQPIIKGSFAEPVGAELNKFPLKSGPLSVKEQDHLGLAPGRLERPTVVQNHFRNIRPADRGRFVLETLPAGTPVLVDKKGNIRYKADCGNRVVEIEPPPSNGGLGGCSLPTKTSQWYGEQGG